MRTPILYETHTHTPLCNHACGEPEEYVAMAEQRGLKGIIFTCHNPMEGNFQWSSRHRMTHAELPCYAGMVERARRAFAGRVDVRLGLESDYAPGHESWLARLHAEQPFNYVLGSVHPQISEYRARFWTNDPFAYQQTYFDHIARAAESKLFDCLSHPDLVKNLFPSQWSVARIMPDIQRALDRIAKTGTSMELNTSGLHKDIQEMNPGREILAEIQRRGIPVVVGGDCHHPQRVGADFDEALRILAAIGFTHVNVYLERKRHPIAINTAIESLNPVPTEV